MGNRKTTIRFFTIPEYEKEQDYLRKEHNNGWKFTKVTFPCFYHFEKAEPEDVIYQLDYNQEGIEHKTEYVRIFQDCGWEYLQDFVGYSYFRKPVSMMEGEEEIYSDATSKLDMVRRVFKGRIVPLLILFFGIILPQLALQLFNNESFNQVIFGIYIGLFVLYAVLFAWFGIQYWALYRKVKKE